MSEKTKTVKVTKAPTPTSKEAKKEEKAKKEATASNDIFTYRGELAENAKKLAPQAQGIVNIVEAAGKKGLTRAALVEQMSGVVTTRQPLGRILSYYQKALIENGYFTLTEAAKPEENEEENED